jgi:hypothetical protein
MKTLTPSDRFWLFAAIALMFGGITLLACHHEADGLGCAEKHCEVTP